MKTYRCDFCGDCMQDPFKRVRMREITLEGKILRRSKKIHICERCWAQIVDKSRRDISIFHRSTFNCTGCEYINDDSGYCYDCYNCSKKYVKDGGNG